VARINVEGWRVAYRGIVPDEYLDAMRPSDRIERVTQRLGAADPAATLLAVGEDGSVGAYAGLSAVRDAEDRHPRLWTGELAALYADPVLRGSGAGGAVHDAGVGYLTEQGFAHAVLWVLEDNEPSRRFYEARGWTCDGVIKVAKFASTAVTEVRYSRGLG
jgi:GNAT superfamily N-acetyltransferase